MTIINDRDKLLQATVPRYAPPTDRAILLGSSANQFNISAAGVSVPLTIALTPTLLNMINDDGSVPIVTYSTSDASPITQTGNGGALAYSGMLTDTAVVTVTVVLDSVTYTASQTVTKIFDTTEGTTTRAAFSKTTLASLSTGTISTEGDASFPPDDSWGAGTQWTGSQVTIAAGEVQYQSDGIYSPITDATIWGEPYRSTLKVGALSAITANIGSITAGDLKSVTLHGGAGYPTKDYSWPALSTSGGGFHLSGSGLLLGNEKSGKYFKVTDSGNVYSPQFSIVDGAAKFYGALSGASGTFSGKMTADAIDAVSTINIGENQVTVPVGQQGYGSIPSLTVNLTQPGRIMVMVMANAISGNSGAATLTLTAKAAGRSGGAVGITMPANSSGAGVAFGTFDLEAGSHTVSGDAVITINTRDIAVTAIFAMGIMR
jgi:hypothetical protein